MTMRSIALLLGLLVAAPVAAQNPITVAPVVGTPADNETNTQPFLSRVGAYNFVFDGTTWDRWTGSVTVSGTVTVTGTVAATQSGTWTVQPGNTANSTAWLVTGTGGTFPATQSGTWTVQPGNTANTTAWKVDGSAVTQPVSGTVTANQGGTWNVTNISGTVSLPTGAATAAKQPALGTAGSASADVISVQGIASMTPVQVSQATAANLNARTDTSGATGAAPPARAEYSGFLGSGATGGLLVGVTACDSDAVINIATATTTRLVTGVSGRQVRICAFDMVTAAANNVAWIEGTGATCGTGSAGMAGGSTAASGYNFAANGGIGRGSGIGEVLTTATTGDSVCLVTSAAVQLSGHIKYAIY